MLRIGYINAFGLSADKIAPALSLLYTRLDILVLAETWDVTFDQTRSLPEFVGGTDRAPRTGRRANGGMVCLAPAPILSSITLTHVTPYSLDVVIAGTTISAVYFPPSLSETEFTTHLSRTEKSDIIIGDFNTRFGRKTHDTTSGPPDRVNAVYTFITLNNLKHIIPDKLSRVDHVFTRMDMVAKVEVFAPPFRTDHVGIIAHISTTDDIVEGDECRRYHLRELRSEDKRALLVRWYLQLSGNLDQSLDSLLADLPALDVAARQTRINIVDSEINAVIQDACESSIKSYKVNDAKKLQDRLLDDLKANANPSIVTQIYKRSCRAEAVKLKSSSPGRALSDDIKNHFVHVFTPPMYNPDAQFHGNRFQDPRYDLSLAQIEAVGVGDRDMTGYFGSGSIMSFFASYNVSKCCGSDSIHTLILKRCVKTCCSPRNSRNCSPSARLPESRLSGGTMQSYTRWPRPRTRRPLLIVALSPLPSCFAVLSRLCYIGLYRMTRRAFQYATLAASKLGLGKDIVPCCTRQSVTILGR